MCKIIFKIYEICKEVQINFIFCPVFFYYYFIDIVKLVFYTKIA